MKSKLTIFVPTYKRHHLLDRLVPYLADLGLPVLIIDSTETPHELSQNNSAVDYVHCPELGLLSKVKKNLLERVKTPYLLVNADDMFPSEAAIVEGIEFLEENHDYSGIQGDALGYKDGEILFAYAQNHSDFQTDSHRPSTRLLQHFVRYYPMVYSVQRTDCWKNIFERMPEELVNHNFIEFYAMMMMMVHGKVARVHGFYHVTDIIPSININSARYRGTTKDMRSNGRLYPELSALKRTVAEYLLEQEDLTEEAAFRYVEGALDMYLARLLPSRDYYWLRNKPPKTFHSRIKREWDNLLNKVLFKKQRAEEAAELAVLNKEQLAHRIDESIERRREDFEKILKAFAG